MKNPYVGSDFQNTHKGNFTHLHLHSQYSLLDGAIRLGDLMKRTKELGMPAIACTDHGNMFGAIDFYTRALSNGIKPILGSEIYFTPGSRHDRRPPKNLKTLDSQDEVEGKHQIHHLILLCKNLTGYQNLCKLLSKAYQEGFYYKPRADAELLREFSEGLIATTACLKGEVGYNLFTGQDERAVQAALKFREIYKDDFYLEIQENGIPEQMIVNEKILSFSKEHSIPMVATNDCHYLTREDAAAQEVLMCIQTGKTFEDEKRMKLSTTEFYLKSPEEMRTAFHYAPEACDNTMKIADKCNLEIKWQDDKGKQIYLLPKFEIKTQETEDQYFERLSKEGLEERFAGPHFKHLVTKPNWETELKPQYVDRLDVEVGLIKQMGFTGYFLIVADFIGWSKANGIPVGPGRGSGAGSIVAYALKITNVDPIPYNLLFERFINPERISMPDFDIDFCQDRRQEVIEYVTNKYGKERVGQIITFGTLSAKAVLRDVSRVFALPYSEADTLAKLVPEELGIELQDAIDKEPKLKELEDNDPKIRRILQIGKRLEGLNRHAGIHAAGVIITNEPLVTYCPLFRGANDEQVVQFDKDFSEKIGLVKFDFLGLKTLTVISNAEKFVRRDFKPDFDIEDIDIDDKSVYDMISDGKTVGVFQLESSGMQDLCKRIKPGSIDDITAINALYRPGPMGSGMHLEFAEIKNKINGKVEQYSFDALIPVLKDTYGIIVYQEQVMNIARVIAGYSLGQADMLRRAMGKKKAEEMQMHKEIFRKGAVERGFDEVKAIALFELMEKFAEYGFNKSHAVAYSVVAYQTAFLKKYYPAQFFAALLGTEINNKEKITSYIQEAKDFGISILPPDINESLWLFNVIGDTIRFGLGAVKGVGEGAVEEIVRERTENGPFTGFVDFCERVNLKAVNKRVLESLIKVGAFGTCEKFNRKTLLENMELITSYAEKRQEDKLNGQTSLFDMGGAQQSATDELHISESQEFDERQMLSLEAELLGIYVSGHPLFRFRDIMAKLTSMNLAQIQELPTMPKPEGFSRVPDEHDPTKRTMVVAGMISESKVILTKKGEKMAFVTIEDLSGKIECLFFPRTYAEFQQFLTMNEPLIFHGVVNLTEDPKKFFPNKVALLKDESDNRVTSVRVALPLDKLNPYSLQQVKQILLSYRGSVPIHFIFETIEGKARLPLDDNFLVNPSPQMAAKINEVLNTNSVSFIIDGKIEEVRQ
ncbi:MAG: DNA polymerase III subunit alpha [Bdellovibrionota bacterium]